MLDGARPVGATGASDSLVDQRPTQWSDEAERMRLEGWWVSRASMLDLCPYSSIWGCREAENPSASSEYFQILIERSNPADAICVEERNLAALIDDT